MCAIPYVILTTTEGGEMSAENKYAEFIDIYMKKPEQKRTLSSV